ncbi:MAG: hypothetical protein IJZ77_02970 [Bacilli bacterium]|nr:hypothetical protein [Bacilli bacterium]
MKYKMKLRDEDRRIAVSVFKTAFYQQAKKPTDLINVGYGYKVNKHNLEDVKILIEHEIKAIGLDFKYGLITREENDNQTNILNQLKKSIDNTISAYYS